jgi:hypothetical protein
LGSSLTCGPLPTIKHDATLIRSPETCVDHEVVGAAEILHLLGIYQGTDHSFCLFIGLRPLHLLIVGVRSVLFSRRDTLGPRCSSAFQVLYEISVSVLWHLKGVKRFKLNAPQLLPVVSWNSTYQPASAVNRGKPRASSPLPNVSNKYHTIYDVPVVVIFAVVLLYLQRTSLTVNWEKPRACSPLPNFSNQ